MDLKKQHARLIEDVKCAKEAREYILNQLRDPRMAELLTEFETDTEQIKEQLTACEKKDIDRLQAQVFARRELLKILRDAHAEKLEKASAALKSFEEQNTLFIHGESAETKPDRKSKASGE